VVPGDIIARIIANTVALVEGVLGNWGNETNVSGDISPSLLSPGETPAVYLGDFVEHTTKLITPIISFLG